MLVRLLTQTAAYPLLTTTAQEDIHGLPRAGLRNGGGARDLVQPGARKAW
ncbi:hypothetical protein OG389_05640 [Streptomyces sp. NBC_00435]